MKKSEKKSKKESVQKSNPKSETKRMFDIIVKNSIEDFTKNKKIQPQVIFLTSVKKMVVAPLMDCKNSEERFLLLSSLGKKLAQNNVTIEAAIAISESWMSRSVKKEDFLKTEPSKDPKREEILMFSAIDNSENAITVMYAIERNGDKIVLNSMKKEIDILDKWVKNDKDAVFSNFLLNSFWDSYKKSYTLDK